MCWLLRFGLEVGWFEVCQVSEWQGSSQVQVGSISVADVWVSQVRFYAAFSVGPDLASSTKDKS